MISNFEVTRYSHGDYYSNVEKIGKEVDDFLVEKKQLLDDSADLSVTQNIRTELNRLAKSLQAQRISASEHYNSTDPFYQTMEQLRQIEKQVRFLADKCKAQLLGEEKQTARASEEHVAEIWEEEDRGDIDYDNALNVTNKRWCNMDDDKMREDMRLFVRKVYERGVVFSVTFKGVWSEYEKLCYYMQRNRYTLLEQKIAAEDTIKKEAAA